MNESTTDGDGFGRALAGADRRPSLAAVVEKPRTESAVDALRDEGVYDDSRRIRERDAETVEIPVTASPGETVVSAIVDGAPELRERGLDSRLRARGWPPEAIDAAPSSWAVVGDVVLVRFDGELEEWSFDASTDGDPRRVVAEELRDLNGASSVLHRRGIDGPHREPEVELVAGEETRTVHVEAGTEYALDLATVMFSPGNRAERVRMGSAVDPGERVIDAFAGIGYFALPMARAGAAVTAVERNPNSFAFLLENARRNDVEDRLTPVEADCRDVLDAVDRRADRIVMGHFDAHRYLDVALDALAPGGRLHLHATAATEPAPGTDGPRNRLERAVADAGRTLRDAHRRRVKGYSGGVDHVVVDATVA